ncbi:MAG: MBL fold metallo-hydrolase [Hyphomonadaceae bacterium]
MFGSSGPAKLRAICLAASCIALAACATPQDVGVQPSAPPETAAAFLPPVPGGPAMEEVFDGQALRVILCGTSSPLPDPNRAKSCTMIVAGDKAYVVDTGSESWEQLARMQVPGARIAAIFLTHYHSDHIGDLGEFRMQTMVAGRTQPLPVYGPPGVKAVVGGFNQAYAKDAEHRLAHHGPEVIDLPDAGMEPHEFGTAFNGDHTGQEVIFDDGELKVTAFEVDHDPVVPAVGYRFDWKGRSVVLSGDTGLVDNLTGNASGADVLVAESLADNLIGLGARQAIAQGNPRIAKILADIPDYHMTPVQAATVANQAGVKLLVYSHHTPSVQVGLPLYFAGVNAVRPQEQWVSGYDGLRIDLPVGSADVIQSSLLPKP